jgi:hypothetical protein
MPRLAALLLVVAVHLAVALTAWQQVGFLADDTHMVGGAVLRHTGTWSFASMFVRDVPVGGAAPAVALYRPFLDLVFWLEQPWFGFDPLGYHVVNSAMHCATALLWLLLVQRLTRSLSAGLAAAVQLVPAASQLQRLPAALRRTVEPLKPATGRRAAVSIAPLDLDAAPATLAASKAGTLVFFAGSTR